MNIRPYRPNDLDAVIAVFRSNIPKYFAESEEQGLRDFLKTDWVDDYYVVELDGEVVGAGGIAYNDLVPPTVSLCWGMIRSDHLGTGLGKALTEFRIQLACQKYPGLPLTIGTSQHTEGFYKKFGFSTVKYVKDGFGLGIDECKMRREP
ncbi:MAG: GNAT family N-acetyltransferase [Acidobacteria bacterium]|nr:GNAT family N-acetyltransferase [Acidobacteriota bacterium]